jgi:hypothetical protein
VVISFQDLEMPATASLGPVNAHGLKWRCEFSTEEEGSITRKK